MPGFPKPAPAASKSVLERWTTDMAREDGLAVDRVRRGISFMVVSAVLTQLIDTRGVPLFILKGGVAMELRFGMRARTSKDYDTAFREDLQNLEAVLELARRHPVGRFVVTAGPSEPIGTTGSLRTPLRITYGPRPWATVKLEASRAEGGSGDPAEIDYRAPVPDLSVFGFEAQSDVPCLPVRYQIAQKIHACTEVLPDRDNDRFRDLIDLLLLAELVADDEWPAVRAACMEVFSLRRKQAWPPTVTVYPGWPEAYSALATETEFSITDVTTAAAAVHSVLARIDSKGP